MGNIFEMITEYASEHYYDKFGFNNEELADLRDEMPHTPFDRHIERVV